MSTFRVLNHCHLYVSNHSITQLRCLYTANGLVSYKYKQILSKNKTSNNVTLNTNDFFSPLLSRKLKTNGSPDMAEKVFAEPTHNLAFKMVQNCPEKVQPYLKLMRIDRPIGTWLVFLPCAWSIALASPPGVFPDSKMLLLFGLGSFFMRGAGCTINDMWDKDFDKKVERTRNRPLACGEVTHFKALCFLSIPLSISLSILLTFNWNTILLGVCSMFPCIFYPVAKRFTYWPQFFLGITQGWGVLIAWCECLGSLQPAALSLYFSSIFWTAFYDTIYSHQDIEDDLKVGVKSTAIRFGENTKQWLAVFNAVTTGGLLTTGYLLDQNWIYYASVAFFSAHLTSQVWSVDLTSREDCGNKFRSNRNIGLFFFACILASTLLTKRRLETHAHDDINT